MSWPTVDEFNTPRQEIVKCVVVGDTAVGKTRLICAQTCNAFLTLPQMLATHIPTVWAIDQYRIHKEVLRRSWKTVDGVDVSLRLWDTFGDHEKDRKFAYGRSDVVLLCFSIASPQSFKHCKTKWYPEIRQYCPNAPIILVGCKNDLRHIYRDKTFVALCKTRSPFVRIVQENDLITREQGRLLGNEIGAVYYESSVFTPYGVEAVFENVVRGALLARRQQRFWVKNLKNVTPPVLQMPFCPPAPREAEVEILPSTFQKELSSLLDKEYQTDVILVIEDQEYHTHRIILAAASSYLKQQFISSLNENDHKISLPLKKPCKRSAQSFLKFLYTGSLENEKIDVIGDIQEAAEIVDIIELKNLSMQIEKKEYKTVEDEYSEKFVFSLKKICLEEQLFLDVMFEVDDGKCSAHRSLLMARCDVMAAMFGGDFLESTAKIIQFPGVSKKTFDMCLYYLYTDKLDERIHLQNCLPLIELANRLCLPHFISLLEWHAIQELSTLKAKGINLSEQVFRLLEPCQVHNANQLANWCQHFIITHYKYISMNSPKLLRNLHQDNQAHLNKNRWPPVNFLKEQEFYERYIQEQERTKKTEKKILWRTAKKKLIGCIHPES